MKFTKYMSEKQMQQVTPATGFSAYKIKFRDSFALCGSNHCNIISEKIPHQVVQGRKIEGILGRRGWQHCSGVGPCKQCGGVRKGSVVSRRWSEPSRLVSDFPCQYY